MTEPARNELDLAAWWMPFTANRQFKAAPRLLTSAKGMMYRTADGRELLDGVAGLWCVNAGHGRPEIAAAVNHQLLELDYAPPFQMGHPLAFTLAARLARLAPPGLDRIFFTNSGSESVDTALKIALAYHRARGEGQKTRFIGRERGWPPTTRQQFDYLRSEEGYLLVGSPQQVIDKILYEHELFGHTRFLAQMSIGAIPHQTMMHSIELFGNVVAPAVRKALQPALVSSR